LLLLKTELIAELVNGGGYYFLSRPRRFRKSLFLDTLKEAFEGNKILLSILNMRLSAVILDRNYHALKKG
jgi:hypothetical protein